MLKTPFTDAEISWADYVSYRPHYPSTLFDRWRTYHTGPIDSVHDIGAGCGILAAEFARRGASQVFVSDLSPTHLQTAEKLLAPKYSDTRFQFHCGPGEQGWLPAGSVDFVCIGEATHWMDADKVVRQAAESLRPGGTFGAVFYGASGHFVDCAAAEVALHRLFDEHAVRICQESQLSEPVIRHAVRQYMTGLDFVPFPHDLFEDVRRINANVHDTTPRFAMLERRHLEPVESKVADGEQKTTITDASWGGEYTVAWLKAFLQSLMHGFDDESWTSQAWKDLEKVVQENGGKVRVNWPAAIVMARRK